MPGDGAPSQEAERPRRPRAPSPPAPTTTTKAHRTCRPTRAGPAARSSATEQAMGQMWESGSARRSPGAPMIGWGLVPSPSGSARRSAGLPATGWWGLAPAPSASAKSPLGVLVTVWGLAPAPSASAKSPPGVLVTGWGSGASPSGWVAGLASAMTLSLGGRSGGQRSQSLRRNSVAGPPRPDQRLASRAAARRHRRIRLSWLPFGPFDHSLRGWPPAAVCRCRCDHRG
jgi:hypothetical protein